MTIETELINLLDGLRKQSPKAQQLLLEHYGREVFAQIARLIPRIENAEEVYQDTFVKVFKNIRMYDVEKSSLKTWISRIAYNESITYLRHKSMPVIYYEDREGEAERISETEVETTFGHPDLETVQLIRAALKHLPPDERAIITMFYYEEMSLKEIAYVTESIPTTVASKLSRTRKKLYRIIKMLQS
jgi:RNA polymerase sigma-70 factor (ECF subfamily)